MIPFILQAIVITIANYDHKTVISTGHRYNIPLNAILWNNVGMCGRMLNARSTAFSKMPESNAKAE